ncbi:hypothetical protein [Parvibaculum sp.]|uniref:hypothetical protein n=1 Tax=Parvibaculum sp. TaxID=2024848 RepID=UPI000C94401A|nr:hypothetical protein [Parvibaculum sp.]MAB15184.1 hypothetical protein [Parvibaculum sp.]
MYLSFWRVLIAAPGLLLSAMLVAQPAMAADSARWIVTKPAWSQTDEEAWRDFVAGIGAADCWTVQDCLKSAANPYRFTDKGTGLYDFLIDCADAPLVLRAYFAWKNGLPFAWEAEVKPLDEDGNVIEKVRDSDVRYSPHGNAITKRDAVPRTEHGVNAPRLLQRLTTTVSTAMHRYDARAWDPELFSDTYSPALNREAIQPGTIAYDSNGHIALVWKVEQSGRIRLFSAQPDNTVTRGFLGHEYARTGPELGAIFQKYRPIRVVGATRAPNGALVGGHIEGTPNSKLPDYSLEQYTGNPPTDPDNWRNAQWVWYDETMDFYTYLRAKMSFGDLTYRPLDELRSLTQSLCRDLHSRQHSIEVARDKGTDEMPPPERLPENIYGTDGLWESYSTPARDARLKTSFKQLYDSVVLFVKLDLIDAPRLDYDGNDLPGDMLKLYNEEAASCLVTYRNSAGKPVTLDMEQISRRLFRLSFDPYQCVERRWGARGAELSTCPDGEVKTRWYEAEQKLRNQIERTYDVRMDYTAAELEKGPWGVRTGRGVSEPPNVDVRAYLEGAVRRYSAQLNIKPDIAKSVTTP